MTSDYIDGVEVPIDTYDASTNVANKCGDTPPHLVSAVRYTGIVDLLTSYHRCDLSSTNESNETPAYAARLAGHTALAEYLTSK